MDNMMSNAVRSHVLEILKEETTHFFCLHKHLPIGREMEDVVDNAFSRIRRTNADVPYIQVSDCYVEMMTSGNSEQS